MTHDTHDTHAAAIHAAQRAADAHGVPFAVMFASIRGRAVYTIAPHAADLYAQGTVHPTR